MSGPSSTFTRPPLSQVAKSEDAVYAESAFGRYPWSGNFRRQWSVWRGRNWSRLLHRFRGRSRMHPEPAQLREVPFFDGLEPDELERLASWLDVEDHGAGTLLTHEGRTSYAFFVLASGDA